MFTLKMLQKSTMADQHTITTDHGQTRMWAVWRGELGAIKINVICEFKNYLMREPVSLVTNMVPM